MKAKRFATEADFARGIVASFRERGFRVYQEVAVYRGDCRADIVAVRTDPRIVTIIETKLSLSLDLIDQCRKWHGYAHYVFAAAPSRCNRTVQEILEHFGIGLLDGEGSERIAPRLNRHAHSVPAMLKQCVPERENYAEAGNAKGRFWSPWRGTCDAAARFVAANPGCTVKELIAGIQHHYGRDTTARHCVARDASFGRIDGVRVEKDRCFKFFPTDDNAFLRLVPVAVAKPAPAQHENLIGADDLRQILGSP